MRLETDSQTASTPARDAYGGVAHEYDHPTHRTTRALEELSERGLRKAYAQIDPGAVEQVLEIGAGTGALTRVAIELWPDARLLATDPSPEMLEMLSRRTAASDSQVEVAVASSSTVGELCNGPDLVLAGLADPYLDSNAARDLRDVCAPDTSVFVSVPSRSWATRERHDRLGVDAGRTRFRLGDGSIVFAPSLTYDQGQLCELLQQAGCSIVCSGTERSQATWTGPEVCWALARPAPGR